MHSSATSIAALFPPTSLRSDQAAEAIVSLIASGDLQTGERIVEQDLAARFGVSRVPVREALQTLAAQGVVRADPIRGVRVAPFDEVHVAQVNKIRLAIESIVAEEAMVAIARDPRNAAPLAAELLEMTRVAGAGTRTELNRADVAFHRTICRVSSDEVASNVWEALSRHVLVTFGLLNARYPDARSVVAQHRRLLRFLCSGDAADIAQVLADHIAGRDVPSTS